MEFLKQAENYLFQRIQELQDIQMESKLAFLVCTALKFFFKEGFIVLFLLLPITITQTIKDVLVQNLPNYQLAITLTLTLIVIFHLVTRFESLIYSKKITEFILLLLPWLDMLNFPILAVLILITSQGNNTFLSVCSIITAFMITLFQITNNLLNFSKSPRTSNLFHCRQARLSIFSNIALTCFCIYLLARWANNSILSKQQKIIYAIIHFTLSAIKFKQRIIIKYFIHPFAETVGSFVYLMELNIGALAIAETTSGLYLIAENLPYLLFVTSVLAYYSMRTYLIHRQSELHLSSSTEMKEEDQAVLYLDCLGQLARKVENQEEDIILISLRTKHELSCINPQCFCNFAGKDLNQFIRSYVRSELNVLSQQFHNYPSILISILYFKMVLFKFYPQILTKINQYRSRFTLNFFDRYYCYWLSNYVARYISKLNQQIKAVESQHMFKLEQLREEMEGIIRGEVEMREKKWKYLARGLCRIEELEEQCESELNYIQRMMIIFYENRNKFKKSKQFNLLLLFYFLKISFLNNGKELKANLKEIYYGFKIDELRSLKEFKKFIFHKSSCAVETQIDAKSQGIITTVSRNVEEIFGMPADKIKGNSINVLMPEFMGSEHDYLMNQWAKTSTWASIGKLKEVYCVHKDEYCFSALIYLKIYVRDNALYFITNIFKLNDSDYLLLNTQGKIEGIGRKFLKMFGEQAKNLPLHLLIENAGGLPNKEDFEQQRTYRRVFMGLKGIQPKILKYREQQENHLQMIERQSNLENLHCWIKSNCVFKYFVEFTVQNYKFGRISFPILHLKESRAIERSKTSYFLQHTSNAITSMRDHLGSEIDLDVASSRRSQQSKIENDEEGAFENMANSSMASMSQKQNYPLSKLVEKFLQLLLSPNQLQDRRIVRFSIVMVVMILLMALLNFMSYFLYRQLLMEIQGIFLADGAVSDIMQTTEIAYAHVYQLRSQFIDQKWTDFDSQLQSARYIQNYVYGLKQFSFSRLAKDKTQFSNKRLYQYIQDCAVWTNSNGTAVQLDAYQFLEHMYYLTNSMVSQLQYAKQNNQTNLDLSNLFRMVDNFPQMKRLNQYYLADYQTNADVSHSTLNLVTIASLVLFAIISLILAFLMNSYYRFRFEQAQASFKFLSIIPNQLIQRMKQYYSSIIHKVIETNLLKSIDKHQEELFTIDTTDIGKVDLSKFSSFSKIKLINYNSYYRWIAVTLLCLAVNALNYLATTNIRNFFAPSSHVIELITALMRAQNRLLESYFDMKAKYYLSNPQGFTLDFFDKVQNHLYQGGERWNFYANELSNLLITYSPQYQEQFRLALATNVCKFTEDVLPAYENQKCVSELALNMLDGGIMISMNFFRATVLEAMASLKAQYVTNQQSIYPTDYFRQLDFTELDKMEIYMFKIYQQTQSICYDAFIHIINDITSRYLLFAALFLVIYACIFALWWYTLSHEKKRLARLYARLILVPFGILKANARIVNSFKEAIEYSEP